MQSEIDAERMRELGYSLDQVHVMGNLKYDFRPPDFAPELRTMLEEWKGDDLLWVAGSTMAGEEEQILDLFSQLRLSYPLKLLIAPRHPERFGDVARMVESRKLSLARRSSRNPGTAEVMVLDSIGELAAVYQLADLVLMGGTVGPYGGHNPVEPAYFGKAIVTGPYYGNFRTMFRDFLACGGILVVQDWQEGVRSLLASRERREEMGRAARDLVLQNAGSTELVLNKVNQYWDGVKG
jgi:3-deoxy-D-manno-octulosonic-acid transferase